MHEMSLVQSLLDIVRQEMDAHRITCLQTVKVACGRISGVVPDALEMAFQALTTETDLDGAALELEIIPLKLACGRCAHTFTPEHDDLLASFAPCPECGHEGGHTAVSGRELHIEYIEGD